MVSLGHVERRVAWGGASHTARGGRMAGGGRVNLPKLCPSGDTMWLPFLYQVQTDTEEFIASFCLFVFVFEIDSCSI